MKAVLFDVYETLIRSVPIAPRDRRRAMEQVAHDFGIEHPIPLDEAFHAAVRKAHAESIHPHPEIDVRVLWKSILPQLSDPAAFASAMENAAHPTSPVEGAAELLESLHHQGVLLGIVSNAQAYTHALLDQHLGEAAQYFSEEISIFSYQRLRAKPDPELFVQAIAPLLKQGIMPEKILMIGDSPDNDILPAQQLGLETHLIPAGKISLPAGLT